MVYAASNKQYREAYLLYLREAVFCLEREAAATSSAAYRLKGPGAGVRLANGREENAKTKKDLENSPFTRDELFRAKIQLDK